MFVIYAASVGTLVSSSTPHNWLVTAKVMINKIPNPSHMVCVNYHALGINSAPYSLLTFSMLRQLSAKVQGHIYFCKPSKTCHVGIH